ncbi:TetR/AcrR family transcriptional regulator [Massilia luteola]|uniref:TetR/AcrR family transcriptional regulator n=1 Tax=Massilia luteola TaxID=3081751 RepID=UPI002ACC325C|nr:TetR/AcrR family transcriptional regulator [Massilia sp. Gc5]
MDQQTVRGATRRGRPSIARANALDSDILKAASEMFLRDGFDAVSMEAIAGAVPLSKTTLYARFPSKQVLLEAVIKDQIQQWSADTSNKIPPLPEDIGIRLRVHMRAMAVAMRSPAVQGFMKLGFVLADRLPTLARLMHEQGHMYNVASIRAEIEAAAARDKIPVRDAEAVARHLVNSVAGWNIQEAGRGPSEEEALAAADDVVMLFMAARWAW